MDLKNNKHEEPVRDYEWPSNDETSLKRGNLLKYSLMCIHLKEQLKALTDESFDALDDDHSGSLDHLEIGKIMTTVALSMGVQPPSQEELQSILNQLDENFDGVIDKEEFFDLIYLVVGKMIETEEEL